MKRIGVFGGTFNPPHIGHGRLVEHIRQTVQLDRLLVIPTFLPPHKVSNDLASCEDRLAMCRLAFPNWCEVSDLEIRRGGKSYTVDTLTQLKAAYPNDELVLLIGSDMMQTFDQWVRCEDILQMCTVCVTSRADEGLDLSADKIPAIFEKHPFLRSDLPPFEVSSTQIRQRIRQGEDTAGLLLPEVRSFIEKRGLYRGSDL
ncbi:MAG TPA: nicotinate (nicotinamide) nucleotide adenylyltransferase [Ruminococcaceae bacterium]|nr:nicotinate (nicotinamide) nucleotide adenylyltransferase [Oscillospiraceae bacterium]